VHRTMWLRFVSGGAFAVFHDAAVADAGTGPSASADAGGAVPPGGGDPDVGEASAGVNAGTSGDADPDDDLFEDEEAGPSTRTPEEQIAALRAKNRKLAKRVVKSRALTDRLKDVDVDDVLTSSRQYRELERQIQQNPKLRALLYGDGDAAADPGKTTRAAADELPSLPSDFSAEALGFDPTDGQANKTIANAIRHLAHLSKTVNELKALQPTVQTLERTMSSRQAAEEAQAWSSALNTATTEVAKALPNNPFIVDVLTDAIKGAYANRRAHGKSPQQIVEHYLGKLKQAGQITPKAAAQVSAGVKAGMAQHNKTLPASPAGGGAAAPAAGNTRPTLKDVHKRLRSGQIGPR
jgi:hypothetical protein